MSDKFQTEPYYVYSGSYTDLVHYGDPLRPFDDLNRQVIISRATIDSQAIGSKGLFNFALKNILQSDRLRFCSGSYAGSRTQMLMAQAFDKEQIYDSFVPSPIDIVRNNDVILMTTEGSQGSLVASEQYNLPASINDIPIAFGTEIPASLQNITGGIDTQWMHSRTPFSSRYKNLNRILQPSYFLPQPYSARIDFRTGQLFNPPVQSNLLGTIFYTNDTSLETVLTILYTAPTSFPPDFGAISSPVNSPYIGFYGTAANTFPQVTVSSRDYQIMVGSSGTIAVRHQDESNFRKVYGGTLPETFYGAASSRGQDVFFTKQFGTWVVVGENGSLVTNDKMPGGTSTWVARTPGIFSGDLYSVANARSFDGTNNSSGIFVAVGQSGSVVYSSDYTGTSWTLSGSTIDPSFPTTSLKSVEWIDTTSRFITCGESGVIYKSKSVNTVNSGWDQVYSGPSSLHCIKSKAKPGATSQVVLAVGDNGTIVRSQNAGDTWTVIPPANSHTGSFRGIARGIDSSWIIVGDDGEIQYSSDNGLTWNSTSVPGVNGDYHFVADCNVWPDTTEYFSNANPHVIGGPAQVVTKPGAFIRVTDIDTSGSYAGTGQYSGYFVNEAALIQTGGIALPGSSKVVRSTYVDLLKAFYGTGPGITIDFSTANLVSPSTDIKYLNNRSVEYDDYKIVTDPTVIETVRLIGPRPRGFGYGIANVTPQHVKTVWRRDHYGHFRDMLEQRPFTKTFTLSAGDQNNNTLVTPLSVTFVSGSTSYARAIDYTTASSPSYDPHDSGLYDYEYRSGQPFFDDRVGLEY